MKKRKLLKDGGTIALVAPSFGCTSEPYATRLEKATENFLADGFKITEGQNIRLAKDKARSNSARECAKEFMNAYASDADVIISVGGGEIMCEILPYIDFEKIKKMEVRTFMGFSDNTNLTYTLTTLCDIPTVYGPDFPSFGTRPYQYSQKDALDLLMGKVTSLKGYSSWQKTYVKSDNPLEPPFLDAEKIIRTYPRTSEIILEGRLLGGCLDCLVNLCGTRFDKTKDFIEKYKDDGIIWFLEACDLSPVAIERALFQLKNAGWFKYAKGFLFGRPLCFSSRPFGITHYGAYSRSLKDLHVPLIEDIDLGHFYPSLPIITGAKAKVIYKDNNIEFIYGE